VSIPISTASFVLDTRGTLDGGGNAGFTINSAVTWSDTGGLVNANVTMNGPVHITSFVGDVTLLTSMLTLYGPTTWDSSNDIDLNDSSITNYGVFTAANAQNINDGNVNQPSNFYNLDDGHGHRGSFIKDTSLGGATIKVRFTNQGDLSFTGTGFGTLTFTANFTQMAAGHLKVRVGGPIQAAPGNDKVVVNATATLAGSVDIDVTGGFNPAGAAFDAFDANAIAGVFANVTTPWTAAYTPAGNPTKVTVSHP
jgi:hypothetical protein